MQCLALNGMFQFCKDLYSIIIFKRYVLTIIPDKTNLNVALINLLYLQRNNNINSNNNNQSQLRAASPDIMALLVKGCEI